MEELETKLVIGLMSGTSCDSIDAGLCEVRPDLSVKLISGINYKYPEHVRAKIFQLFSGNVTVKDICQMNFVIGHCFADACKVLIEEHGKPDFIASHGQTIFHYPFDDKLDKISLKSTLHKQIAQRCIQDYVDIGDVAGHAVGYIDAQRMRLKYPRPAPVYDHLRNRAVQRTDFNNCARSMRYF